MTYREIHRYFLRTIASRGVISVLECKQILDRYTDGEEYCIQDIVKAINKEIKPFQQVIKMVNDEVTNEEVIVFLSLGYDDATKSQNIFTANELEYFRLLIEQIMTTETRQVTGIHALNIVSNMKSSFTKTDAEKLLNVWCKMRYLDKEENNYALGVRAIHEFEGYLRQNMPDTIEECFLCKQIVFRGINCPACAMAIHTRCLNRYLEKVQKWPCCRSDFNQEQIDRLNSDSSRCTQPLSQTQHADGTQQQQPDNSEIELTQQNSIDLTHIIPEISQRITRKRKRE